MASSSKSNRRTITNPSYPKVEWSVKQPTKNWLELPTDLTTNILQRIGVRDIFENVQKVCSPWRRICKEPAMWRVMNMEQIFPITEDRKALYRKLCRIAVDRSQGQVLYLTILGFCDEDLLQCVVGRSNQLRRIEIKFAWSDMDVNWGEAFKNLSLLEELDFGAISQKDIEAIGRYCPLLKTLKVNQLWNFKDDKESRTTRNDVALAIGKNLPQLTHLELVGNGMTNIGLQAILDGCCHLESLDLRRCLYVNLKGDLGKRCSQQIKDLKLPHDAHEWFPRIREKTCDLLDDSDEHDASPDLEKLSDMLASKPMFG